MTIIQAILLGIIYYLGNSSLLIGPIGYYTVYRPLVSGFLAGVVLGDPVQGTIIGATINLMYVGFISAGGALPGDMCLAGILGSALGITGGLDTKAALALAVPIGLIGTLLWFGRLTLDSFFVRLVDKKVAEGDTSNLWFVSVVLPQAMLFLMTFVPASLACYFGASYVQGVIDFLGQNILNILIIIGGMMPALGIGLTLMYIFKGEARVFFFAGFLLAIYSGLSMVAIGFISLVVSAIYAQIKPLEVD